MPSYLSALQQSSSRTARTENAALTHSTSHNPVLDFFALAGGMRDNPVDAISLFRKALAADRQLAVRALFYLRDIRGGQGERKLFRTLFKELLKLDHGAAEQVTEFIPEYGRWDDLIAVGAHGRIAVLVEKQLERDEQAMSKGESVSLLGKWLPSENTSSKDTRRKARQMAQALGLSPGEYRRRVVGLRQHIRLLEQQMSANDWQRIEYDKLPSQAGRKHVKAFKRHDNTRYQDYLESVMRGDKKMNVSTLYTYEVFDTVRSGQTQAADAMWQSLPDFTDGRNAIVVADVSGSMMGRPMSISVSLALYFAEHNTGPFKDYFITFSGEPQLVKVTGRTLVERLLQIETSNWAMNTSVSKVFDLLLDAARRSNAPAEEMPSTVYIISDMEFDQALDTSGSHYTPVPEQTNYEMAARKFQEAGFELPHIVFWNVNARNTNVPATLHDGHVTLISGASQSTFRYVMEGKSPVELMEEVLNSERYAPIVLDGQRELTQ